MPCNSKKVVLDKPLLKIVTRVTKDEWFLYSIEFYFRDGTYERMGIEYPEYAGRVETLDFKEGEQLLGCEFHHRGKYTLGMTWIKWNPSAEK